jgi:hypothetical protein
MQREGDCRSCCETPAECRKDGSLSETCHEPDAAGRRPAPNLLTNTETTLAPVTDVEMTEPVHHALARRGLTPGEHAADTGYASADLLLAARARGITLHAPVPPDSSPQARSGGYTAAMFTIDWDSKQVTCPQGAVSSSWTPARSKGTNIIIAWFAKATCQPCPPRARCTTAVRSGRQLGFRHRQIHEAFTAARAEQAGDAWRHRYRIRAGVEGTIAQATHVTGIRHARYLGLQSSLVSAVLCSPASCTNGPGRALLTTSPCSTQCNLRPPPNVLRPDGNR